MAREFVMKLTVAVGAAVIILCSCANQTLTQDKCIVEHVSGFVGTTGNQQRITVARNGSPCVIGMTVGRFQEGIGGSIASPPAHGVATFRESTSVSLISYTPNRDYVGNDQFEVVFSPHSNLTVLVDVVALPAGS